MADQVVIATQQLTRNFGSIRAVDSLTFQVREGEVYGFLGHNGAGKTTTIRLANGLLAPSDGSLRVWDLSPLRDGPELRSKTGVLPETPSLDERLTARENLRFFADLYRVPVEKVPVRIDALLDQFELSERADDAVGDYSKGMKQRLALARTILHEPPLLFMDEPTAGLDPVSSRQVQDLILRLSEAGHTVFLCTHNLQEAQRLCHRVAVLRNGALIAEGTPEDLSQRTQRHATVEVEIDEEDHVSLQKYLDRREMNFQPDGRRYRIHGMDLESVPGFIRDLSKKGVSFYRVHPVEPSLEDVYFALHEQWEE